MSTVATPVRALTDKPTADPLIQRDTTVQAFLKPFRHLLDDQEVTEIAVNDEGRVWFEKKSTWFSETDAAITQQKILQLGRSVATYSAQEWDARRPLLSASLNDGSRIQLVCPPAVEEGRVSFTVRKPAHIERGIDDFAMEGLFNRIKPMQNTLQPHEEEMKALLANGHHEQFIRHAIGHRLNIVVAGATGSGKTTFMKGLVREIPASERLITIEDVRELFLPHKNTVHLLYSKGGQSSANVTPKDLLESCLRMKPDRILLAEVRGDECLYFIRNAASGHPGSMTSCHAGSPALAFEQMAIMIQDSKGGANLSFEVIKRLLTLTVDVVIQFQNVAGERFISEIYYEPQKKLEATR